MAEAKKRVTGPLRCPKHHIMLKVASSLWLCQCEYVTGRMTNLKGAVDEARRLAALSGGVLAIQEARRAKNREAARKRRELRIRTATQRLAWP